MRVLLALVGLVGGLVSCDAIRPAPPAPFEVVIRVESDPGHPLQGAIIAKGGKEAPTPTGPDGKVTLKIPGQEGESVDLTVKCPQDYVSSSKLLSVSLRRGSKLPQYDWSCPPAVRHVVVAIRADSGPNLPVVYFGKSLGRTDPFGVFTYLFTLKPGDSLDLQLDTSGNERMHPQNPMFSYIMRPVDDIVTFEQRFKVDAPPVHYVAAPARPQNLLQKRPDLPRRINY